MRICQLTCIALLLSTHAAFAATAKHTTGEYDETGSLVSFTETVAHDNGDTISQTYGVASGDKKGALQDTMFFRAASGEVIVESDGHCQVISANADAPAGMPAGGMDQYAEQMKAAQAEMEKAIADMAKQNPQMAEQMRNMMQSQLQNNPMVKKTRYELLQPGDTRTIDGYRTEKFEVRNVDTGTVEHTVWAARSGDVDGGKLIGRNTGKMMEVFQAYMEKLGVADMAGGNLMAAIGDKMETHYPIMTEDHSSGTRTRLLSTDGDGPDSVSLSCQQ